jgi:hypothetical protein
MSVIDDKEQVAKAAPQAVRRWMPSWIKRTPNTAYWLWYDAKDAMAEVIGDIPLHTLCIFLN